jgi:uncharacterized membrane protein (DUF2068 family)
MLRDLVILRLLAVERLLRGLAILLLAYAVFRFRDHRGSVITAFREDLPLLEELANRFGWDLADSSLVHTINSFLAFNATTLTWLAVGLAGYGALQLVEATGLWLLKRWGEYFAVVATSVFIPLEVYELVEKVTWVRIGALIINIAAVVYLLVTKRLFGLRGGHEAYMAERHEANLLEVEVAAETTGTGAPDATVTTATVTTATEPAATEPASAVTAEPDQAEPNIEALRAAQDRTARFAEPNGAATGAGETAGDNQSAARPTPPAS